MSLGPTPLTYSYKNFRLQVKYEMTQVRQCHSHWETMDKQISHQISLRHQEDTLVL